MNIQGVQWLETPKNLWYNKDKLENPCVATGWRFVLILFPLKTALKWGLREGVKNQGCT